MGLWFVCGLLFWFVVYLNDLLFWLVVCLNFGRLRAVFFL